MLQRSLAFIAWFTEFLTDGFRRWWRDKFQ